MIESSQTRRLVGWAPAVVLMAVIFYISSQPAPEIIQREYIRFQDKWLHIVAYLILAALFARALIWEGVGWTARAFLLAVTLSALYGATDEWHQVYVPERTADWVDWVADLLGATLVFCLWKPLRWLDTQERVWWTRKAAAQDVE